MIKEAYDLLANVRDPLDTERKDFEREGFVFLAVEPKTLPKVIEENPHHFARDTLVFAKERPTLRDYAVPKTMLVAVKKPTELFIPGSFSKDRPKQLSLTQAHSAAHIETINPDARAVMLPATALAQLDIAHRRQVGNPLFKLGFGRALDNVSEEEAAFVGRYKDLLDKMQVGRWRAHDAEPKIGAALTVVFTAA